MADFAFFSSPNPDYDTNRIILNQENLASSPLAPRHGQTHSLKPRRPPTVTPNRFTRFFTPRDKLSTRGTRQSKASRRLQDITKNGVNRRAASLRDRLLDQLDEDRELTRPGKRRKHSFDITSSPPQSSPLRNVQLEEAPEIFLDDTFVSSADEDEEDLLLPAMPPKPFPEPINRRTIRSTVGSDTGRLLHRSFGGHDAVAYGWKGKTHANEFAWEGQAANFVSKPRDRHGFSTRIIPFCAASCNTNSLVAIGEEEGRVRLIDSDSTADFGKKWIQFQPHRNSVMDLSFSGDDFRLATASGDHTIRLTDVQKQQTVCVLTGHTGSVKQVRWQPDNNSTLVSSSRDGRVHLWDLRCSDKGPALGMRFDYPLDADGNAVIPGIFPSGRLPVGSAHRTAGTASRSKGKILNSDTAPVSVTAIQHLGPGREHLLVTATELDSSLRLWDLRNATRRQAAVPLSMTPLPLDQSKTRNFGTNSLALSEDGCRLFSLSRNGAVYAYATNNLATGAAPELNIPPGRRRLISQTGTGAHPIYTMKSPDLNPGSFYCRLAVRKARNDQTELLAVGGSPDGTAVLFPTDERLLKRQTFAEPGAWVDPSFARDEYLTQRYSMALKHGHRLEVTAVVWTHDGNLVTVSDDFTARCWREDAQSARHLRSLHEGSPVKYGYGYAKSSTMKYWDCEDEEAASDDEK